MGQRLEALFGGSAYKMRLSPGGINERPEDVPTIGRAGGEAKSQAGGGLSPREHRLHHAVPSRVMTRGFPRVLGLLLELGAENVRRNLVRPASTIGH